MLRTITLLLFLGQGMGHIQSREDDVLKIMNAVRTDPQDFIKKYLTPYLKENKLTTNRYAKSLISDLKKTKKMEPLKMSAALSDVAKMHALDMGRLGKIGHSSSDGTSFADRIRKKAKAGGMIAENCDYGNDTALDIVMALLIDDGIESLGHRKNILEPKYQWVGIAIEGHKTYRVNTVMDFAERF
ncbi:MAG: CAP domain-containing protein [Cyclobacteriaceae bacterium]|nr:CAP domain-containing protein [Cyclobacteriaceae bacterium]